MPDNMFLWNQVCETDPHHTRRVNQRGGFTAIDAQWQIENATRLWGPYGFRWGLKDCEFKGLYSNGDTLVELALDAKFYYPILVVDDNGETVNVGEGFFDISADIAYKPGNDSRKKLMTDATTKALSKLGFNADVFLGKFDDNKYIQEMEQKFHNENKSASLIMDRLELAFDEQISRGIKVNGEDEFKRKYGTLLNATQEGAKSWRELESVALMERFFQEMKTMIDINASKKGE